MDEKQKKNDNQLKRGLNRPDCFWQWAEPFEVQDLAEPWWDMPLWELSYTA